MNMALGLLYLLLGAICGGSFGLPSKYVKKDTPWEVLWGPFFFFVTVLIPVLFGPVIVKEFFTTYGAMQVKVVVPVLIFGFLWGLGSMTLGLSFGFIGLSLAYALNYGAQIVTGAVGGMAIFSPADFSTSHGAVILLGVATCVAGVIVSGRAAMLKEKSLKKDGDDEAPAEDGAKSPKMLIGVTIGIVSGILCACYGIAYNYAGAVGAASAKAGNAGWAANWAVMALIVWGGVLSACGYCAYKLTANHTWGDLKKPGICRTLSIAFAMALLHDGAILLFGLGAGAMGSLGGSVGYAVFMSFAIIVGNAHGFSTGEWKGASKQSVKWIAVGLGILVIGVCILATGNGMKNAASKKKAKEKAAVIDVRMER